MSNMRTRNLIAGVILLLLCAGYAYLTANLPTRALENTTQPSFFPWIITVCMAVLSLALLAQGVLPFFNDQVSGGNNVPVSRLINGFILAVAYMIALPSLGFVIANIVLFAGLMVLYGERNALIIAIGSIVIPVAVFFIFREIFLIRLPLGILPDVF